MKPKRVAIVAEWLTSRGGAENVVAEFLEIFPNAELFTTVYNPKELPEYKKKQPNSSFLQKIPILNKKHQWLLLFLPQAIKSLNLEGFDLIISSSSAFGKGINKPEGAVHVCYCHTPMRYVWQPDIDERLLRLPFGKIIITWLKKWDLRTNQSVDYYLCNSNYTKKRVASYYKRKATVIYPPVKVGSSFKKSKSEDFYLIISRLIPYKRFDLAIRACNHLKRKLIVAGEGPERKKLQKLSGPTIEFLGRVDGKQKKELYQKAKALIFPAEEDFGIVPIEAMAEGTPVIGYGKGGVTESVINGKTGVLFQRQIIEDLVKAILKFEKMTFSSVEIRHQAEKFSQRRFAEKIKKFIAKI